jgi:hypothetical protein
MKIGKLHTDISLLDTYPVESYFVIEAFFELAAASLGFVIFDDAYAMRCAFHL